MLKGWKARFRSKLYRQRMNKARTQSAGLFYAHLHRTTPGPIWLTRMTFAYRPGRSSPALRSPPDHTETGKQNSGHADDRRPCRGIEKHRPLLAPRSRKTRLFLLLSMPWIPVTGPDFRAAAAGMISIAAISNTPTTLIATATVTAKDRVRINCSRLGSKPLA